MKRLEDLQSCKAEKHINMFSCCFAAPQKSLGEEVNELTSSRLLKLEKENQALLKTVEELGGTASQDTVAKLAKVNQENQRLNQKVNNELLRTTTESESNAVNLEEVSFSFSFSLFHMLEWPLLRDASASFRRCC